jgi:hypothetical protein
LDRTRHHAVFFLFNLNASTFFTNRSRMSNWVKSSKDNVSVGKSAWMCR